MTDYFDTLIYICESGVADAQKWQRTARRMRWLHVALMVPVVALTIVSVYNGLTWALIGYAFALGMFIFAFRLNVTHLHWCREVEVEWQGKLDNYKLGEMEIQEGGDPSWMFEK